MDWILRNLGKFILTLELNKAILVRPVREALYI